MFGFLKLIFEALFKGLSIAELSNRRDKKRIAEIGTEMLLLYSSLNGIISVGDAIVHELESTLRWLDRKRQEGKLNDKLMTHLKFLEAIS